MQNLGWQTASSLSEGLKDVRDRQCLHISLGDRTFLEAEVVVDYDTSPHRWKASVFFVVHEFRACLWTTCPSGKKALEDFNEARQHAQDHLMFYATRIMEAVDYASACRHHG